MREGNNQVIKCHTPASRLYKGLGEYSIPPTPPYVENDLYAFGSSSAAEKAARQSCETALHKDQFYDDSLERIPAELHDVLTFTCTEDLRVRNVIPT